jgi:hypothetical protein
MRAVTWSTLHDITLAVGRRPFEYNELHNQGIPS